jgi:hypothetical protein
MSDMLSSLKKLADDMMAEYRTVQNKIQEIEHLPKVKALVGRYFKHKSGYNPKDGLTYKRVIGHSNTNVIVDYFHSDHYGKVEFCYGHHGYVNEFNTYTEITAKEYFKAHKKLVARLQKDYKEGTK